MTNSNVGIFYGFGNGNFTIPKLYPTGLNSFPFSIAIGDFNNDSRVDLAISYCNQDSIGIMFQLKSEPFSSSTLFSTGDQSYPKSVAVDNFNNDDQLDIAVANSGTNNIGILLGYGDETFANVIIYFTGISSVPSAIAVNDLNKDNNLDLVVTNWGTNNVLVFVGIGDGTFFEPKSYSVSYDARPQSVTIGDINNDDLLDIVVANYGTNYVEILLQTC